MHASFSNGTSGQFSVRYWGHLQGQKNPIATIEIRKICGCNLWMAPLKSTCNTGPFDYQWDEPPKLAVIVISDQTMIRHYDRRDNLSLAAVDGETIYLAALMVSFYSALLEGSIRKLGVA